MRRVAVIVGINKYALTGCDLRGCVPDAERYRSILVDRAGYRPQDVYILLDGDATTANIKSALTRASHGIDGDDSLHFICSSHGAQTVDGDARTDCLCPHDFDWSPEHLISAEWLHDFVAGIPESVRVRVVLDSCHSGDTLRDLRRPGQDSVVGARAMPGSPAFTRQHGRHLRFRDLATKFPSAGFIAACRSSETAADARFGTIFNPTYQGALSWYLQAELEKPKGLETSLRLVTARAVKALRAAGYEQHPVLRGPWEEISKGFTGKGEG